MLDDIGGVADHARDQHLFLRNDGKLLCKSLPIVLVARIGELDRGLALVDVIARDVAVTFAYVPIEEAQAQHGLIRSRSRAAAAES